MFCTGCRELTPLLQQIAIGKGKDEQNRSFAFPINKKTAQPGPRTLALRRSDPVKSPVPFGVPTKTLRNSSFSRCNPSAPQPAMGTPVQGDMRFQHAGMAAMAFNHLPQNRLPDFARVGWGFCCPKSTDCLDRASAFQQLAYTGGYSFFRLVHAAHRSNK